jgi:hypothetical protein
MATDRVSPATFASPAAFFRIFVEIAFGGAEERIRGVRRWSGGMQTVSRPNLSIYRI